MINDNYPPGFTQADHDRQYAQESQCSRCERTLDECEAESGLCESCQLFVADPGSLYAHD